MFPFRISAQIDDHPVKLVIGELRQQKEVASSCKTAFAHGPWLPQEVVRSCSFEGQKSRSVNCSGWLDQLPCPNAICF